MACYCPPLLRTPLHEHQRGGSRMLIRLAWLGCRRGHHFRLIYREPAAGGHTAGNNPFTGASFDWNSVNFNDAVLKSTLLLFDTPQEISKEQSCLQCSWRRGKSAMPGETTDYAAQAEHNLSKNLLKLPKTYSVSYELGPLSHNKRGVSVFSRKFSGVPGQGRDSIPQQFESESELSEQDEVQTGKIKACPVVSGNQNLLLQNINEELSEFKRKMDKSLLKRRYEVEFRPLLSSACLLLPEGLHSESTNFLHTQYHHFNRRTPQYLSSYELMIQRERIDDDDEWGRFWNQIISNRVFIAEDWGSNIGNVETLHYDYGIKGFCKGEVDASYHDGKGGQPGMATLSIIIWRDNKVIYAEVFSDVKCSSIHVAEAYAVLALFFKCFEMGIEELVFWTDNSDIQGSVTGSYTVSQGRIVEERDLLLLLGCMAKRFSQLVAMWKPRELLFLADALATDPYGVLDVEDALKKFDYQLSQKAVFRLSMAGPAKQIVKKFVVKPYIRKHQTKCFLLIDNLDKMDAIAQIIRTMCPSDLFLAIDHIDEKPEDFHSQVKELPGCTHLDGILKDDCTILHHTTKYDSGKRLLVVVDGTIPRDKYEFLGCFSIILVSAVERQSLDPSIEELSALSYCYFNGVK